MADERVTLNLSAGIARALRVPKLDVALSIHPDVDLAQAFAGMAKTGGRMAEGLRKVALNMAADRVRNARHIRNGARRHAATKTRRDVLKRLRKLEAQRRGWVR